MAEHKFEEVDKTMFIGGMPKNPAPGSGMQSQYALQYGNYLRGGKPETHIEVSGDLRNKQSAAWQSFIEDRRVALYNEARKAGITEAQYKQEAGNLQRIKDAGGREIGEWARDYTPNSAEFLRSAVARFNELSSDLETPVAIREIPEGPITGHSQENPVVPLKAGPLYEESVLERFANEDGGFDFPDEEAPIVAEAPEQSLDDILEADDISESEDDS